MLNSYLIIAWRNLLRSKTNSIINIGGLAIGLSCFAAILLFVEFELSFDRFHTQSDNVYRVVKNFVNDDGVTTPDVTTPPALASALRTELPEVELVTRFATSSGRLYLLEAGDKRFYETKVIRSDSDFFKLFTFQFVKGSADHPFDGIQSVVLTETLARKYFGDIDPMGKIIRMNLNNGTDYVVTAVVKDVPQNSHFSFDLIIPFESRSGATLDENWDFYGFLTYARLRAGSDPERFESNVKKLFAAHQPNSTNQYYVQSLPSIHLQSNLKDELSINGDMFTVRVMMIIGFFIILIAAINYINLVTAQSAKRAREIGIRKVTGAQRNQLVWQLLAETFLTIGIALLLAVVLASTFLPFTKSFLGYDLYAFIPDSKWLSLAIPLITLSIGIMSGLYPAFIISAFQPARVLKGSLLTTTSGIGLRQGLVVFQFVISTALIIGSLTITEQLRYARNKDLGFENENVLLLPNIRGGIGDNNDPAVMLESMRSIPGVLNIARADGVFGANTAMNGVSAKKGLNTHIALNFMRTDFEFVPTLKLDVKEGRNFSDKFASDSSAIILNERAVLELGLKPPFVGQLVTWDDGPGKTHDLTLIGVVSDFHFSTLREDIRPFGFVLEVGNGSTFFLKIKSSDLQTTVSEIGKVWANHNPQRPFTYTFQDDTFSKLYVHETRFQGFFLMMTSLAIVITCLGVYGLITCLVESKIKEIGIRKVLGATSTSIVFMLSKTFIIMVVIALSLSSPLAWYVMKQWLSEFAYHIDVDWRIFSTTGVASIVIAFLVIALRAIKASLSNPVHALRNE